VVASRIVACLAGGLLTVSLAPIGTAIAFPFIDPTNQDTVPTGAPLGTDLPAADVQGLRNQLRLTNPGAAGNPSGWTITPRMTIQEIFTDNAFEVTSPRVFDAVTVLAPGISILADTNRLRLNFDYQPNLLMHAINGPLNVLTQQLTATGILTVVPDLAYIDVRALSGVQSRLGALAGAGTIGAGSTVGGTAAGSGGIYGTGQGLNRNNEVQTSSFGISPYLLRQFGDYGTGKIGVSVDASRYSNITGFAASPFPTGGGSNGQSLLTTEELAHYTSGEFLNRLQYSFDADMLQSRSNGGAGAVIVGNTFVVAPNGSFNSQRQSVSNSLSYALNRTFTLMAGIGEEHIQYSNGAAPTISGLTWNLGVTITPSPYSALTLSYGRQYGANTLMANGHIVFGGRSMLTFGYTNYVGTQLENLQNQLNNVVAGANGQFQNAQNGGPAFVATNALGVQNGVFRFNTATASWETDWERDTLNLTVSWSEQTSLTPALTGELATFNPATGQFIISPVTTTTSGPSSVVTIGTLSWTHEMSPDLLLTSSASYSYIRRSGGLNDSSVSTAIALQYILSTSTTATVSYSFFDRVSKIPGYSLYENILLLGITKQF
jgi:uncharacterized protein (PEP-CTERM system associated)